MFEDVGLGLGLGLGLEGGRSSSQRSGMNTTPMNGMIGSPGMS